MQKRKVVFLVGGILFGVWLVMYAVQHWRLPNGPVGPAEAEIRMHTSKGWYLSTTRFAGTVEYVRFVRVDRGVLAEIRTTEGWYSVTVDPSSVSADESQPFVLKFQYPKGLPLREHTADSIRVRSLILGAFPVEWARLGGGRTVLGDIAEISVQFKGDGFRAAVLRTSGMESSGSAYGGGNPVEVYVSPTAFP